MQRPKDNTQAKTTFSKWFWGSFSAIFAFVLILLAFGYFNSLDEKNIQSQRPSIAALTQLLKQRVPHFYEVLANIENAAKKDIETMIEKELDAAFAPLYDAVDEYVEFHYTLRGEYTQLFAYAKGGANLDTLIYEKIFLQSNFQARIEAAMLKINQNTAQILQNYYEKLESGLQKRLEVDDQAMEAVMQEILNLSQDDIAKRFINSEAVALRLVSTAGGAFAARGLAAAIGARIAVRLGAKTGLRILGAGSGASVGLLCGPAAAFCGFGGAVAGWLSIDKAIIEIDKYYNKDEFRFELFVALNLEKQRLKQELLALYLDTTQLFKENIEAKKDKTIMELMHPSTN
jgi:hypothetical protein